MTLIGHDAWLEAPYMREGEPVTCAGRDEHGIYLTDAAKSAEISTADLATILTDEDLADGLCALLIRKGLALPWSVGCPKEGSVLTEDDFAPGTDRCGTCGGPTRIMDREELRGE